MPGTGFGSEVEFAASVSHFYESERFRGVNDLLRIEILAQPTAREARKLAKRHGDQQRKDWDRTHKLVMCNALWFQSIEHPEVMEAISKQGGYAYGGVDEYWSPRSGDGAFIKALDYLAKRQAKPIRVFLYGVGPHLGDFRFDAHMQMLFRRIRPDEVLIGRGGGFSDVVEAWAIKNSVAVRRRHTFSRLHRASDASMHASLEGVTHSVLFGDAHVTARLAALSLGKGIATRTIAPRTTPPSSSPAAGGAIVKELRRA